MAFVPGFKHDVFISYATVDNLRAPDEPEGWVELLYKHLNVALAKEVGRQGIVDVWWDERQIDPTELIDPGIVEAIAGSAVMICLNSQGFIVSDYCAQELDGFYDKVWAEPYGYAINNRPRIVHALLYNIPPTQWPRKLTGNRGLPFHDVRRVFNDLAERADRGVPVDSKSEEFKKSLKILRKAVYELLVGLKEKQTDPGADGPSLVLLAPPPQDLLPGGASASGAPLPSPLGPPIPPVPAVVVDSSLGRSGGTFPGLSSSRVEAVFVPPEPEKDAFTIYMGDVADPLSRTRNRIIEDLTAKGFRVLNKELQGIPPPFDAAAHQQAVENALRSAQLSVHLFDEYAGRAIHGLTDAWYPAEQARIALHNGGAQMIWVPESLDLKVIDEVKYREFLQDLESGKTGSMGLDLTRGPRAAVSQQIIDFALQLKGQRAAKPAPGKPLAVLVDTHFTDQPYAFDLGRELLENQIQPFITSVEEDPRANIEALSERMGQIQKLIFLYGNVSKEWIKERINVALRLIIDKEYAIDALHVYMAPPHKMEDISISQRLVKLHVANNSDTRDRAGMKKFVADLKSGRI